MNGTSAFRRTVRFVGYSRQLGKDYSARILLQLTLPLVNRNSTLCSLSEQQPAKDFNFYTDLPDGSKYDVGGRVSAIDRAVDPRTGTLKVRVSFANPGNRLRAGMNCTVNVLNQDAGNLLTIPGKALTEQLGEFYVYVLGDSNKVTQRRVSLGSRFHEKVVIREGVEEGEKRVSEGVQNLRQGAVVIRGDPLVSRQTIGTCSNCTRCNYYQRQHKEQLMLTFKTNQ